MPPTLKRALCIVGATIAIGAFNIREAHADATDLSIGQWQEMGAFFTGDVFNAIGIEKIESNGKTFIATVLVAVSAAVAITKRRPTT